MNGTLYAGLGVAALGLLAVSGLMWLHYGEVIYFDRLITTLAGCF